MNSKLTYQRYLWMVIIIVLAACGTVPLQKTVTPTITSEPTFTPIPQTPITSVTETPTPAPSPTPLPLVVVDGLRVAYIIDGNLYVQDSGGQLVQLTHSGADRAPLFSDDGQKIVFYRDILRENNWHTQMYMINIDGSGELLLVASDLLVALELGYDKWSEMNFLTFIHGTHQLLFNTHQISPFNPPMGLDHSNPNYDLLLVDTDSAKIKQLVAPGQGGNFFLVSPDGKLVAIQTPDHIDVINIKGQVIHRKLATYPQDDDHIWVPLFWTQDSSKLIVMPPIPVNEIPSNIGYPVLHTVWQYSLDSSPGVEIRFTPHPVGEAFSISPDGSWIAYSYYKDHVEWDLGVASGVYLGNLRDGTSQLMNVPSLESTDLPFRYYWSPDSAHFIFEAISDQMYLGNVYGKITLLSGGEFLGWMDATRYLHGAVAMGETGKEADVMVTKLPAGFAPNNNFHPFTYVFANPNPEK